MKIFKRQILIFFLIYISNSSCVLNTFYDAGREIWRLHSIIDETEKNDHEDSNGLIPEITHQLYEIRERFNRMEKFMGSKIIHDSIKLLKHSAVLYKCVDTVELFIQTIDDNYNEFWQNIIKSHDNFDEFGKLMTSIIPNIEENIQFMRRKVTEPDDLLPLHRNLVYAIAGHSVTLRSDTCGSSTTLSKILVKLFKMIIIAEMKVHVIFAITSILQFPGPKVKAVWKRSFGRQNFIGLLEIYVDIFSINLVFTDAVYLKACEPINNTWIRDDSFYELENTFRTAIFHFNRQKCIENSCYDIWFRKADECEADYYDDRTGCSGTLSDCTNLATTNSCVLKSGLRRFHHVNSTEKGLLGTNSACPENNSYIIDNGVGVTYFYHTCACNCLENGNRISLSIMQSNTESNMVITGLRFIRQNKILYIQPKEGRLDADGTILRYSERWLYIPNIIPESQTRTINREDNVFFLDDLRLPSGCVLTGVKFNRVRRKFETGFAIEIFGFPFDYESGNLDVNRQYSRKASDEESGEPLIFEKISSALVALPVEPSPEDKKYVSLVRSNLHEDFGQSTLPLFDAIPITTNPPSPLDGFGIFHKGTDGYAGFISLRIYEIKYANSFKRFDFKNIESV